MSWHLCPPCSPGMKWFSLYFEWLVLAHLLKPSSVVTSSWKFSVTLKGLPALESLLGFLSSIKKALCRIVWGALLVTCAFEIDFPQDLMSSLLLNQKDNSKFLHPCPLHGILHCLQVFFYFLLWVELCPSKRYVGSFLMVQWVMDPLLLLPWFGPLL